VTRNLHSTHLWRSTHRCEDEKEGKNSPTEIQIENLGLHRLNGLCWRRKNSDTLVRKNQKNNCSNHAKASHILTTSQLLTGQHFGLKCKSIIPALTNGTSITSSLGWMMDHHSFGPWYIHPQLPGTGCTHGIDHWTSIFHG